MLNWLLCTILGHKLVRKAFRGEYGELDGKKVPILELERTSFCIRCGKDM